jgi:hypothetical protein
MVLIRRAWLPLVVCLFVAYLLARAAPAAATLDYDWGRQWFNADASEKYGVRGYFKTVNAGVVNFHANFTSSVTWISDEITGGPWVEIGFTKGVNEWHDVSGPTLYFAFNQVGFGGNQQTWCDYPSTHPLGSAGTVHKYAVSRTAHNNDTGQTKWTFYFDGDALTEQWMTAPDQGHPIAGGETYQSDPGDSPAMNAQGVNDGTSGDSSYWCFKNSSNDWYRWDPSHAANTDFNTSPLAPDPANDCSGTHGSDPAISFSSTSPQYSHFTADD